MAISRPELSRSPLARLRLNSFWLLAARLISQALAVLFSLMVARTLGEAVFGQFAFITAVVFIGNVVSTFGLDTLLIRDVAAARTKPSPILTGTISSVLILQLALAGLFILAIRLFGPQLPNQSSATLPALGLAAVSLIPLAFSTIYSAILRGHELMFAYMAFSVVTALVMGLGAILLFLRGGTLTGAAWIIVISQTVGAAAAYLLCRLYVPDDERRWVRPSRAVFARAWRSGAVLAALMIISVLYQRLGVLLLFSMTGDAETGLYSAAARVLEALKIIPGVYFGALFPMLAAGAQAGTRQLYRRSFIILLALSFLLASFCTLAAGPIILLLFGPDFEPAGALLRIMIWSLPLTVMTFKLSFDLVVQGKERIATLSMSITLLMSAWITYSFISRWALYGAAAALIVSEAVQILILALLTRYDNEQEHRKAQVNIGAGT